MEQVFEQMQLDETINPNWTTFSTMATMYIKLGHLEKAEDCLKKIESRITGRDRMPYHYLISLYGSAGNKEEVYRVWNAYKASFFNIPNLGYHTVISALVRINDIDGAEKIYDEWLSLKSVYDPRVGNLLLSSYVRKGLSQKAETFFDQMIEVGGKPNSMTWEILAEDHIRNRRIADALSCLKNAASAEGSKTWRPKPINVSSILKISEQESDPIRRMPY
ncbi:Pentatricopeptide repeat-containing protein [Sesamum angolense]|uniref:Pentatricopeptide repeat-containing protein n=1 Tax=Sesamum angolense TaxID=2727404 RepID=A0AAE1XFE8_9LAMI|nr:Pentatricopeptide repeat-containing protein [Sesamum angolense]